MKNHHVQTQCIPRERFSPLAGQRPTADRLADSNVRLFGHLKGVVNFDTEVSDGTFQLSMTKQQLNGPQIFRTSINQ